MQSKVLIHSCNDPWRKPSCQSWSPQNNQISVTLVNSVSVGCCTSVQSLVVPRYAVNNQIPVFKYLSATSRTDHIVILLPDELRFRCRLWITHYCYVPSFSGISNRFQRSLLKRWLES